MSKHKFLLIPVFKIAGARCEQEKKTLFRAAAYRNIRFIKSSHFKHDWNIKTIIALG